MVRKRAHVEDHCSATRNTCGLEGDIPTGMITKHLVDLELPDEGPNIILCHGTAQMPTIPFNLHVLMVVLRKRLENRLSLTRLHVPT
jgi:hypothetical protein